MNYYSIDIRLNIIYIVNKLSKANLSPFKNYLALIKYLFQYIVDTLDLYLVFRGKFLLIELSLYRYVDALFADDLATYYSTGGYVIFLAKGLVT